MQLALQAKALRRILAPNDRGVPDQLHELRAGEGPSRQGDSPTAEESPVAITDSYR